MLPPRWVSASIGGVTGWSVSSSDVAEELNVTCHQTLLVGSLHVLKNDRLLSKIFVLTVSTNVCLIRNFRWINFRNFCCLEITGINCLVCVHSQCLCEACFIRRELRRRMLSLQFCVFAPQQQSTTGFPSLLVEPCVMGPCCLMCIPESEREGQRARYVVVLWKLF